MTELLWDEAIKRAKSLDALEKPEGSLFGLPISTKEHHGTKGDNVTSNASYVAWIGSKHGSIQLYDILWDAGCVYFARTTQPQSIMHLETSSNIYGRTINPYNRNLTPGGSSGGESALIGIRGSILVNLHNRRVKFADLTRVLAATLVAAFVVLLLTVVYTVSSRHANAFPLVDKRPT